MAKVGVIFGSNAGDAKNVAEYVAAKFDSEVVDAKELTEDFLTSHDKIIFVASTHKVGEIQNDIKAKLDLIASVNFRGKTVGLVGIGGSVKHPDDFNSGLVELLPVVKGAKIVGSTPVDDEYKFNYSAAIIDGRFIGLVVDVKLGDDWKARADKWSESVKAEF